MRLSTIFGLAAATIAAPAWAQTSPAEPAPAPAPEAPPLPPSASVSATAPSPSPSPSPAVPAAATAERPTTGFSFGSYGRVGIASDLRGRLGRPANIAAFASRLDLAPYMEIQFNYEIGRAHV